MGSQPNTYDLSSEVERYRYEIEQRYLKKKTIFVNSILFLLLFPILLALYNYGASTIDIIVYSGFFVMIFIMNHLFYKFPKVFSNLKLPMYITSIAIYVMSFSLIIDVQATSVYTILLLAYSLVALYQDKITAIINNVSLFFIGSFTVFRYPTLFEGATGQIVYVYIILLVFVALLSISSFILIKRKLFFYEKVAKMKEIEIRTINIVIDLKELYSRTKLNFHEYYSQLDTFFSKLSEEIKIENIFRERIEIIKNIGQFNIENIIKKHPNVSTSNIKEIMRLELNVHSKMHYLLYKASQTKNTELTKINLFTDNQFPSFKHTFDHKYTKIIAFSVFYVLLKSEKIELSKLDGLTIRSLLEQDDFYHLIDSDIADIYFSNSKVIDKIVEDILKDEGYDYD
ncbi:MAG: hypothetical protein ACOCRK_08850 [bacterium]